MTVSQSCKHRPDMLSADQQACQLYNFNMGHMQAKESMQSHNVLMLVQRESV